MTRSYLMSFVTAQKAGSKSLTVGPTDGWLVWEPGEWKAPKKDKTTLVTADGALLRKGDALVFHLVEGEKGEVFPGGRSPQNDIVLNDATVSREQFQIVHDGESWCVSPAGAGKSVTLNAQPLPSGRWSPMRCGDRLRVGNVTLTFLDFAGLQQRAAPDEALANSIDIKSATPDHRPMNGKLRVRAGVSFVSLPNPAGEPVFAVRSPATGGLLQISLAVVRVLTAFAQGLTAEQVARDLGGTDAERAAVLESVNELRALGLVIPESPEQPRLELPPVFVLAAPASQANLLQTELGRHPALATTPLSSLVQSACRLHQKSWLGKDFATAHVERPAQLEAVRGALDALLTRFARSRQKSGWVYNSRDLDLHLPVVDELFARRARYFVVLRNPLDTVYALAQNLEQYGPQVSADHALSGLLANAAPEVALARYWAGVYARIRALRQAAPARVHVVRAEALMGPLPTVEYLRAFAFLGLTWAPADEQAPLPQNPGRLDNPATTVRASNPSGGQWKDAWSAEQTAQVIAALGEEPRAWGYSLDTGGRS